MPAVDILTELAPAVDRNLNRHLSRITPWDPVTDHIPWGEGIDFHERPWRPEHSAFSPALQDALSIALATEDELPGYRSALSSLLGDDGPWGAWLRQWTMEEQRHSIALRPCLAVIRAVSPQTMEADRVATLTTGFRPGNRSVLQALVYVALQELATRISHRNTAAAVHDGDQILAGLLRQIAEDENHHHLMYRDLVSTALQVDPAATVHAIAHEVTQFEMPGAGMVPDFRRRAARIAAAGIYNTTVHAEKVVAPLLRHWGLDRLEDLPAQAEQARTELFVFVDGLNQLAARERERAAERAERAARRREVVAC